MKYPRCERLGVLRQVNGYTVVSTSALYAKLGWQKYQKYLPLMRHLSNGGPTPESCEKFLQGLNSR